MILYLHIPSAFMVWSLGPRIEITYTCISILNVWRICIIKYFYDSRLEFWKKYGAWYFPCIFNNKSVIWKNSGLYISFMCFVWFLQHVYIVSLNNNYRLAILNRRQFLLFDDQYGSRSTIRSSVASFLPRRWGESTWSLWWKVWHWNRFFFFSEYFRFLVSESLFHQRSYSFNRLSKTVCNVCDRERR